MKRIAILGSTGSIGCSALRVVDAHPDRLMVTALAAGENVVVAGQFLLDSEANLRAGLGRLGEESPVPAATAPHGAQH